MLNSTLQGAGFSISGLRILSNRLDYKRVSAVSLNFGLNYSIFSSSLGNYGSKSGNSRPNLSFSLSDSHCSKCPNYFLKVKKLLSLASILPRILRIYFNWSPSWTSSLEVGFGEIGKHEVPEKGCLYSPFWLD